MNCRTLLAISALLFAVVLNGTAEEASKPACPAITIFGRGENKDVNQYVQTIVGTVRQSWNSQPSESKDGLPGKAWSALTEFTILRSGEVQDIRVVQPSGDKFVDEAAIDSIRRSAPLATLPSQVTAECVTVNLGFSFFPGRDIVIAAGGVYRVGGGVSAPKAILAPDPAYTKEAQKANYQGVCVLALIVGVDGNPRDIRVVRPLGKGLDEKAIEAVKQWKFEPAMKDGKPVAVAINVQVTFRLY